MKFTPEQAIAFRWSILAWSVASLALGFLLMKLQFVVWGFVFILLGGGGIYLFIKLEEVMAFLLSVGTRRKEA